MDWIADNWKLAAPLAFCAAALWLLLTQRATPVRAAGGLLGLAGLVFLAANLLPAADPTAGRVLFYVFALGALGSAVLMITSRNPVYAALWFATATLSVCGLFLLQQAAFLAAATIIVYAGAIVVTFLFVIMLAQQEGETVYDQAIRAPLMATVTAFLLLGALMFGVRRWESQRTEGGLAPAGTVALASPLSDSDAKHPAGSLKGLGRSLFGDYLFAVELAGTLLLVASIGAIALAPRRSQGTL